jgi:hypothetical protein
MVDSGKGNLGSYVKGLIHHSKESGIEFIDKVEPWMLFVQFRQVLAKRPAVYRTLQFGA